MRMLKSRGRSPEQGLFLFRLKGEKNELEESKEVFEKEDRQTSNR